MAPCKPPLGVWLYGMRIAEIAPKGRGYDLTMRHTEEACERRAGNLPILSCSLPLGRSPLTAQPNRVLPGSAARGRTSAVSRCPGEGPQ